MNIDGHEYADHEIAAAVGRSLEYRWTDSVFGSWSDQRYAVLDMVKFRSAIRGMANA